MTLFRSLALIPTDANLVITQSTIKIVIWSQQAEIGLIGVWYNGNLPQGTNAIGMSRMTSRSQLIFTSQIPCKNHSHTLKLKNSEVIFIQGYWNFSYMSLNSSWKINPNRPLMWTYMRSTQNWPKNPKLKSP